MRRVLLVTVAPRVSVAVLGLVSGAFCVSLSAQTSTVSGRVGNDLGRAVEGATVAVSGGGAATTTNQLGRYSLVIPAGVVSLAVEAPGFAPLQATITTTAGESLDRDFVLSTIYFLQEVSVTAQRREQFIQDVGISMSAHEGDELEGAGILTTFDLLTKAPSTYLQEMSGGTGGTMNISIRGIGLNDLNDGTEAPSVLYVDDFHVLPISAGSMQFYDAERVEVLRGPQGTLFGRNVTGGLVHYVSKDPSDRREGYLRSETGQYRLMRIEGAANVPVTEALAFRFSGVVRDNSAWAQNLSTAPDGHETDRHWSARGQIRLDPSPSVRSVTKVTLERAGGNVSLTQGDRAGAVDPGGFVVDVGPGPFVDPRVVDDFTIGQTDSPEFLDKDQLLAIERFTWDMGPATLTTVSGFLSLDRLLIQDCDGTPLDSCRARVEYGTDEFTQEVRVSGGEDGRVLWTVGAYYLYQNATSANDAALDSDGSFGSGVPGFGFGGPFVFDVDWELAVRGWAGFGQLEWTLSDRFTLTTGLRYSRDRKTFEMLKRDFVGMPGSEGRLNADWANLYPGVLVNGVGGNINFTRSGPDLQVDSNADLVTDVALGPAGDLTSRTDGMVNAKVGLDWRPSDGVLAFGSWSRGTKSGGFNNGFITVNSNADIPFGPEKLDAFEAGVKADLGESLRIAAATFHYRFEDYHAVVFQGLGTRTTNKDASVSGAEVELSAYPAAGLEAQGALGLLRTNVKDISNGVSTFDAEMGLAPNVSVKGGLRYNWSMGPGRMLIQTDGYWVSELTDILNQPGTAIRAHKFANARAAYAQGAWELSAWVRNLTNEKIANTRFYLGLGSVHSWYRPPRWYGAGLSYRW